MNHCNFLLFGCLQCRLANIDQRTGKRNGETITRKRKSFEIFADISSFHLQRRNPKMTQKNFAHSVHYLVALRRFREVSATNSIEAWLGENERVAKGKCAKNRQTKTNKQKTNVNYYYAFIIYYLLFVSHWLNGSFCYAGISTETQMNAGCWMRNLSVTFPLNAIINFMIAKSLRARRVRKGKKTILSFHWLLLLLRGVPKGNRKFSFRANAQNRIPIFFIFYFHESVFVCRKIRSFDFHNILFNLLISNECRTQAAPFTLFLPEECSTGCLRWRKI